jgi:GTP-binding protein
VSIPRVVEAKFIKSAQSIADSLPEDMSEVVFLGRSNVGKSSTLNSLTQRKNLAKSSATPGKTHIKHRVSIRFFIHLRDARHPHAKIDDDVEAYISEFIRPDQRYLTVFTKIDKLNQKERAKLKREFPGSITVSNLKKNGHDRVHVEILQTIFDINNDIDKKNEA